MDDKESGTKVGQGHGRDTMRQIKSLIQQYDRVDDKQFRMLLEHLVREAGQEGEAFLAMMLQSAAVDHELKMQVVRVCGYLGSPSFLIPLKQVVEQEPHIALKKEAVISIAKYNDRRALNVLNAALRQIPNPLLQKTVRNEIAKIKQNNPILALMPRFLEGDSNTRNFAVTLNILKRILDPDHAAVFLTYLDCGRPVLEDGAWELLCAVDDGRHVSLLLRFFTRRFDASLCLDQDVCEDLYRLTTHLSSYFSRVGECSEDATDMLATSLGQVRDPRIRELFMVMLCRSRRQEIIDELGRIFEREEGSRVLLIESFRGNPAAVSFLFSLWKEGLYEHLDEVLACVLLAIGEGRELVMSAWEEMDSNRKELVVRFFPLNVQPQARAFCLDILTRQSFSLKMKLMERIQVEPDYSVRDILLDPAREKEFMAMHRWFLPTLAKLFPVSGMTRILEMMERHDPSVSTSRKYLGVLEDAVGQDPAVVWSDTGFMDRLALRIANSNQKELVAHFLNIIRRIRTFSRPTALALDQAQSVISQTRGRLLSDLEKGEIQRMKRSLTDLQELFLQMRDQKQWIDRFMAEKELSLELLDLILTSGGPWVLRTREQLLERSRADFLRSRERQTMDWLAFLGRHTIWAAEMGDVLARRLEEEPHSIWSSELEALVRQKKSSPRIHLRLGDKPLLCAIRDQLESVVYKLPLAAETDIPGPQDLLLGDEAAGRSMLETDPGEVPRLILLLESKNVAHDFRDLRPRFLLAPFSLYRMAREVMSAWYAPVSRPT